MRKLAAILFILPFFFSCESIDFYEKTKTMHNHQWNRKDTVQGEFNISDTSSSYDMYVVFRHTDAYKYNNIWLEFGFAGSSDTFNFQKLDLTLANDAGGWEGTCMNDICELRKKIFSGQFSLPGPYRYRFTQIMRDNPLEHVMSVGLRVQKAR